MNLSSYFKTFCILLFLYDVSYSQERAEKDDSPGKTEIFGDNLVMVSREKDNHFLLTGNVEIRATNMIATCEQLEVFAGKQETSEKKALGTTTEKTVIDNTTPSKEKNNQAPIGKIEKIFASGKVRLVQKDRIATAGKAEIYPQEGKVILLDSPVVTDPQGSLAGYRITLLQGEQKVLVEKGPGQRPKITLPKIPDLGIDGKKKKTKSISP